MYPTAASRATEPLAAWWQFQQVQKERSVVSDGPTAWVVDQDVVPAELVKAYSPIRAQSAAACVNCRKPTLSVLWLWWRNNPQQQNRYFCCFGCSALGEALLVDNGWILVRMAKAKWRKPPRDEVAWAMRAPIESGLGRAVKMPDGKFAVELINIDDIAAARDTPPQCPTVRRSSTKR